MADIEWNINEMLLQSYRAIFISSQSFLLAVGAMVYGKSTCVLLVTASISLLMIWYIWFPVVRARHLIVDYYKYRYKHRALLSSVEWSKLCSEEQYVNDRNLRKEANKLFGIDSNWRPTRWKLDLFIPFLFSIIWIVLAGC
ncbi:MAG: hypothetical protein Q8N82_08295 [Deltaproteobacteria bacterium]|nr:hypothetical protein [Deltaproteobacteria bacterium]